jgi:uncharacterized protein YjbI with pentapeptide repeats
MLTPRKFLRIASMIFFSSAGALFAAENYEGKDLTDKDFSGKNLTGANFSDTTLQSCRFLNAILNDANFEDADLRRSSFYKATAQGANFKGVILAGGTSLSSADFQRAIFTGVNFGGVTLEDVNFRGADLRNTSGYGSGAHINFRGADLRGANLSGLSYASPRSYWDLQFKGAKYDSKTIFPKDTDPKAEGAVLVE